MLKSFIRETPFGITIILAMLVIGLITIIAPVGSRKTLIVRSGSMQPAIKVGDLIVTTIQKNYGVGDIIAFRDPLKSSVSVTHRIAGIEIRDGQTFYRTRGDANNSTDEILVSNQNVLGRADFAIKSIGKIFAFAKTGTGLLFLIVIPSIVVVLTEVVSIFQEIRKSKKNVQNMLPTRVHLKVILPFLALSLIVGSTYAHFSNAGSSSTNVFSAAEKFPTKDNLKINEFVANPGELFTSEWVEIYNAGSSTVDLTGWYIQDLTTTTKSLTSLGTISPSSFVTLDINVNYLNNSGDTFSLKDPTNSVIDSHTYGSSTAGKSIGRSIDGSGLFTTCVTPTKGSSNNGFCP